MTVVVFSLDGLMSIEVMSSLYNKFCHAGVCTCKTVRYLSANEEWRLEDEEATCNAGAVPVQRLTEVVEALTDSVSPAVHGVVTSNGEASAAFPFSEEPVVTLGG